jgi:signal transduction histidine kinase
MGILLSLGAISEIAIYGPNDSNVGSVMAINLIGTLPLIFARRYLLVAAVITTLATVVMVADSTLMTTASATIAALVALYLVAVRYPRYVSAMFAVPFLLNAVSPFSGADPGSSGLVPLVLVVAALLLGDAQRQTGSALAERDATKAAMADTVRLQVAMGERARIARELHDVVAHHLSVIAVQAQTARLTTPDLTDVGKERFQAIGDTARDALTEMRRLLGVMRDDAGGETEREPQPGLDRLNELIDTARESGTPVRLILQGPVRALPSGVDLTAYRIVQEALTNTRRHAPGARVDIEMTYAPEVLHLRVRDHGPGPSGDSLDGHGLLGMRERAAMVGGDFRAGPAVGGGFQVEANLPIGVPPS